MYTHITDQPTNLAPLLARTGLCQANCGPERAWQPKTVARALAGKLWSRNGLVTQHSRTGRAVAVSGNDGDDILW